MHRFKKNIFKISSVDIDCETLELFLQCKAQLKLRGRIYLRTSQYIKTPFVFGLISPTVIFPETDDMSSYEKRLALIHELTHIRNGDLWLKFAAFVISAVHWFNPLAHLLCREVSVISEEYCDECVVKAMTKEERFAYGNLILKVISYSAVPQSRFCSTLSASTKTIKRRLFNMMNTKKSRKRVIILSVVAILTFCSVATMYAFAANANRSESYTPDPRIIVTEKNHVEIYESMDYEFIPDEEAIGKWEVVDFVYNIDDFEAGKTYWKSELPWLSVGLSIDGTGEVTFDTGISGEDRKMTGVIFNSQKH